MAIIENAKYNSLPEQVEENKDNIKRINEILENIDPEQVATILSDIQALKAEQVVQNTAIGSNTTAINNEKTAREDVVGVNVAGNTYLKTATPNKQILINNDGIISLTSSNFVEALANNFVRISTDNASVKADENNGVIIEVDSDNPKTLTLKPNGDFEVSNGHILKFDTTGSITIDGQPIGGGGGGAQLYEHNIEISSSASYNLYLKVINQTSTPLTINELVQHLNQFTTISKSVTGLYIEDNSTRYIVFAISHGSGTTYQVKCNNLTNGVIYSRNITITTSQTLSDLVLTL